MVRKARQCPCCHGQGPVVKIVHCDGRVETSVVKKEVTEEMMTKWSNFPLLDWGGSKKLYEESTLVIKLDGVGPADNRPSNDQLHLFGIFFYET